MTQIHRIIVVTPAGRKPYLEILKSYILKDDTVTEWHLWDNCRAQSDRDYINELASKHSKIRIKRVAKVDGTNSAINQFYQQASDPDAFYIKMDDDLVYLPPAFGKRFYEAALPDKGNYSYWSPLVVNNAICSWLLKHHSRVYIENNLSANASCLVGWRNPRFAEQLHKTFLEAVEQDRLDRFQVPNFTVSLARFSINCIGFFGEDVARLGDDFCPLGVDDEEWISAVLPSKTNRPGRVIGSLVVAHFSFFTQEEYLIAKGMLKPYFRLADIPELAGPAPRKRTLRQKIGRRLQAWVYRINDEMKISLEPPANKEAA